MNSNNTEEKQIIYEGMATNQREEDELSKKFEW